MKNGSVSMENGTILPQKIKNMFTIISTAEYVPKIIENRISKRFWTPIFIEELSTIS